MKDGFYGIGEAIFTKYGIKPLSIEEEWNLSEYAKQTRNNKMKIIDACDHAERLLETIKLRVKGAPELDDPKHAVLVQELADKVKEACKAVEAAGMVGYR